MTAIYELSISPHPADFCPSISHWHTSDSLSRGLTTVSTMARPRGCESEEAAVSAQSSFYSVEGE